jgi:hypothetical protein
MRGMVLVLSVFTTFACDDGDPPETDTNAEAETGESDGADDSASCELWEGDATYPGDCACASEGEECVQGCVIPDGIQTCAQICEALGETCVENACDGGTYTGGSTCPAPGEYTPAVAHACDVPIPVSPDEDFGVSCCCTR